MATGYKSAAVVDKGGNQIFILQVDPDTYAAATLTVDTYLFNLGNISESTVDQTASLSEFKAEDGEVVNTSYEYSRKTTGTLMQSDAALVNLLADTVKGKTYLEGKYTGYVNSLYQWHFKIVKVTPQFSVKRPGGATSMPYESVGVKLKSVATFAATTMTGIAAGLTLSNFPTTTLTIGISKSYEIMEV